MRTLRIFISSPGDVRPERVRAFEVVTRLQAKFRAFVKLEPILWEHDAQSAYATFQKNIVPPSETDIVICILWARIGMRLPDGYKRPDGTVPTGTEWEFEDAYMSHQKAGLPDLYVYRKTADPVVVIKSDEQLLEWQSQKKALDVFFERWFRTHDGAFKAGFNTFLTDDDFEGMLAQHLEKVLNEKLAADLSRPDGPEKNQITWFEGSPFRGLQVFQPEHAPIFFGRDLAVREIADHLMRQAGESRVFMMLLGMSGSGKSSLARAGVLPYIMQSGVMGNIGCWRWTIMRPSEDVKSPLKALATALLKMTALPEFTTFGYDIDRLHALLRDAPVHIVPPLQTALELVAQRDAKEKLLEHPRPARLILLVDQLEELYAAGRADAAFITALGVLSRSGLVWVVTTMRSDFYGLAVTTSPELLSLKGPDGQYDVTAPGFSEIREMIFQPARAAGLRFEVEPDTQRKLDDALYEEACRNPYALPLLEFTLDELYKSKSEHNVLRWETYKALGGLKGAIARRADDTYSKLSEAAKAAFPAVLAALISVSEKDTATAKSAAWVELQKINGADELVNAFVQANLFLKDENGGVRLAHEALLTNWQQLQNWTRENRDFLRVKARIAQAAAHWQEEGRANAYLLRPGKPLAEAEDALKKRRPELSAMEIEIVEASVAFAARQRRNQRLTAAAILMIVLSLIFGSIVLRQVQETNDAKMAEAVARRTTSETDFSLAADEMQKHDVRVALAYLADALRKNPGNEKATALAISMLGRCPLPIAGLHHGDEVQDASFSPDGLRIVTASADGTACLWEARTGKQIGEPMQHDKGKWVHRATFSTNGDWIVTASWDGTARIWNGTNAQARLTDAGQPVVMQHPERVVDANFSPDGNFIVTACWDHKARIWDARTGELLHELSHSNIVWTANFSPDGKQIVTASADRTAMVWDAQTGKPFLGQNGRPIKFHHNDEVNLACFSPDGQWVLTGSDDGEVRVWDAHTGRSALKPDSTNEVVMHHDHDLPVNRASFSPDGQWIVSASSDCTARVWDARTGEEIGVPMRHDGWVRMASFSPDGRLVVTASYDGTARIWDAVSGLPYGNPMYHGSAIYSANFSPDGHMVVTASFANVARVWDVQSGRADRLTIHAHGVESASFSPRGDEVATASADGKVCIWNAQTGVAIMTVSHETNAHSAIFSSDGHRMVTASADGTARLWNVSNGQEIGQPMAHDANSDVITANFSPSGKWIVTTSSDGTARLWDGLTGEELSSWKTNEQVSAIEGKFKIKAADFSPDENSVVTASEDGQARVWDVKTGSLLGKLNHGGVVNSARFSPDGKRILTASADHRARIWDAQSFMPIGNPMRHDGWVLDAEFSPNGKSVVTASGDNTARVWDAQTGQPASEPMRHDNAVTTASFSPDNRWVVTASVDGTARIWDAQTGKPVSEAMFHDTNKVTTARFSPDGEWVLTAAGDGTARIWESVATAKEVPPWLIDLAESVGGLHLDTTNGVLERTTMNPVDFREKLRDLAGDDDVSRFGRWFVADPVTRSVLPSPVAPAQQR